MPVPPSIIFSSNAYAGKHQPAYSTATAYISGLELLSF